MEADVEAWIETLPGDVVRIRCKVGQSRALRKCGEVELVEDDERRELDDIAREVVQVLTDAGFPEVEPAWGLDALNAGGVAKRTKQGSSTGATSRPASTDAGGRFAGASTSDFGRLCTMVETLVNTNTRALDRVTGAYARELAAGERMRAELVEARTEAAEAAAAGELYEVELERAQQEQEQSIQERGLSVLESLGEQFASRKAGGVRVTPAGVKRILRTRPDLLDELADDPEVLAALAEAGERRRAAREAAEAAAAKRNGDEAST